MLHLKRTSKLILSSFLLCALLPACDKKEEKKDDKAEEKSEADKELEERLAAKKAERAAEEKAVADKAAAIKALATLPEELPKDIETACAGVATAQDEFMQKHYDGEGLTRWNEAKEMQLGMVKTGCVKAGSIEIAACQIVAMGAAPADYKKDLPDILGACIETYGAGAGDAAAPPAQ
ncbi:hypothetical protein DB30_03886 [Enhygromyxa salina]|uniref:Uncharacterized protein n=1 Tax=Enhygromyxa salina TaxID=215803 RepID=A0A0C2DD34_9BACT|nr:hypothetical protein [Enhygromyxa salina]KIG19330.1 hypothetical protein DB30_03886 [Enhygromyxa salina]